MPIPNSISPSFHEYSSPSLRTVIVSITTAAVCGTVAVPYLQAMLPSLSQAKARMW